MKPFSHPKNSIVGMLFSFLLLLLVILPWSSTALADLDKGACTDGQRSKVVTSHTTTINGKEISYNATAGFIEVTSNDKSAKACIFYTAYEVQTPDKNIRPLTFAFNGGPGSSSVWLHLGLLGPKRANMGRDGLTPPKVPELITNSSSLLDISDIVMIDPVATGFSHTEGGAAGDKFFGVKNDYTSIAGFIRNYLDSYNRWLSPKFILGESYGGIRGTYLANYLQSSMNIRVDGLILVSPALSKTTFFFSASDNLVPYWTNFPSFAASAWYHGKVGNKYKGLQFLEFYSAAKIFARNQLRDALEKGIDLSNEDRDKVASEISDLLGLSKSDVLARNLRIRDRDLFTGLMASSNQNIGRYDSRFLATNTGGYKSDPSGALTGFSFAAGINEYLRKDLNFAFSSPYNISGEITSWANDVEGEGWDVMPILAQSMSVNPGLKVFIASGYFDLATPTETVAYELRLMPNAAELKPRILHNNYFGGHMMYINSEALIQLKGDLSNFIQSQAAIGLFNVSPFLVLGLPQ